MSQRKRPGRRPKPRARLDYDKTAEGCPETHKRIHPTREAAWETAKKMGRERQHERVIFAPFYIYTCPFCNGLHLTHAPLAPRGEPNELLYEIPEAIQRWALEG